MTITLPRQGRVNMAVMSRFQGHGRDLVPLSPDGVRDAEAAVLVLRDTPVDFIVASPMTRARRRQLPG